MSTDDFLQPLQAYAGRWVALTPDNQVAGTGDTGPAALRAGRHNWPKIPLTVRYIADLSGQQLTLSPLLSELEPAFAQIDRPLFLVGGAVRDAVLGRVTHDLDFSLPTKGIKTAFHIGDLLGKPAYVLDKARDTGRVVLAESNTYLDFVAFRGDDLAADLHDRDLTINAMAIPILARTTAEIIDPTGGLNDLKKRKIRHVHARSLLDDPIRGMRAVRMAIKFDFEIEPETAAAAQKGLRMLDKPSAERVRDELLNLINIRPHQTLPLLHELGGLAKILPEVARLEDLSTHGVPVLSYTWQVLAALDEAVSYWLTSDRPWAPQLEAHLQRPVTGALSGRELLTLGAIFQEVGQGAPPPAEETDHYFKDDAAGAAETAERLVQLRFSREAVRYVKEIVRGHRWPAQLTREPELTTRMMHRFFKQVGAAGLDIGLLALANHIATYGRDDARSRRDALIDVVGELFDHFFLRVAADKRPSPLLDGDVLMRKLGLPAGPEIGRLLTLLEEAQIAGEITTEEEALALARELV